MVRELHVEHHSLNFPLKNYIKKNISTHRWNGQIKRGILLSFL
jgi:hypothetical protein